MTPADLFPLPSLDELPPDLRERIEQVAEKSGFVPNVFLLLARRPDEFRAFFAYHDALMLRESALSKAEKEMIVVATSAANDCTYCVVAHGAILRIYARDPLIADQIATHYQGAEITERQRAMLDFAVKLARQPAELRPADYETLAGHGLDAEAVWDIGAISALFACSNRMAHLTGLRPNPQFYSMGR
jgi:uncharacterized peroxidase-related enzyme